MYIITVEDYFASAHQLRGYQGKCENIHGHNWKVVLDLRGETLNDIGLLMDFHEAKDILKKVLTTLDHRNINQVPPFDTINPSSENLARHIAQKVSEELDSRNHPVEVDGVTVWESDTSRCRWIP